MPSTQTKYIYREGGLLDKEQIQKLGTLAYGQYSAILTPENWDRLNAFLQDTGKWEALIKQSRVYVCIDQNEIIGMVFFIPRGNPWDVFKAEWSYIRMLGVNPAYGGQGIAKTLTKLCIEYARLTNEKTITLHTSEFMDSARHIYESLGFKILQEIEPRLGKKYWLYTLTLSNK